VDRADGIRIEFEEAHGHVPDPVEVRTLVRSIPRPRFAYGVQVADNLEGNGDGLVQPGERVTLYFTVKNIGEADSFEVQANVQNKSREGILLQDGRFEREEGIARGEEWVVPFTFQVNPKFQDEDEATLLLGVVDTQLGVSAGQKVTIPIVREAGAVEPLRGASLVSLQAGVELRERPDSEAPVIGRLEAAAKVAMTARSGGFVRVDMGEGRPGWVRSDAISASSGKPGTAQVAWSTPNAAPEVALDGPQTYATTADSITLRGRATDQQRVRDLFITTSGHKVFYESNPPGSSSKELAFNAEIPLRPGLNTIMVAAREDANTVTRRYFVVRRDGEDGALLETKKFEGALLGNGNGYH
jgi:carboxyl-terminal processing protease